MEPLHWRGRAIALVDMDAFFASVEQLDHPEWKGKPVIIGGDPDKHGIVSTCSYEARKFGVHSAMPSAQARKLCSNAIWTFGNFQRYREVSFIVRQILISYTPFVEQVSIDEAYLDITPSSFGKYAFQDPVEICQKIQTDISKLGVTASLGLGSTKTIAKIASEQQKPNGITVVLPGTEKRFLAPMDITEMGGIGKSTSAKLRSRGITTLGELARTDDGELYSLLGTYGPKLKKRANGQERNVVKTFNQKYTPKSVSTERTFETDLIEYEDIRSKTFDIADKASYRLRKKGLCANTLTLKFRYQWADTKSTTTTLPQQVDDTFFVKDYLLTMIDKLWTKGLSVRLIGVEFGHVTEVDDAENYNRLSPLAVNDQQLTLFADTSSISYEEHEEKRIQSEQEAILARKLTTATDDVKKKFGDQAVMRGRSFKFQDGNKDNDVRELKKEDDLQ